VTSRFARALVTAAADARTGRQGVPTVTTPTIPSGMRIEWMNFPGEC
jgi:creatinine amidohydrolase/Fe(II)-dependent formamide hydrolase-like protein